MIKKGLSHIKLRWSFLSAFQGYYFTAENLAAATFVGGSLISLESKKKAALASQPF
jgi:hypothetical protein